MVDEALFSSGNDEWSSPIDLFNFVSNSIGGFDIDLAASAENHLCENYYSIERSAFDSPWFGKGWLNPAYTITNKFVDKFIDECRPRTDQLTVVWLVPSRTDTKYFHRLLEYTYKISFIKGRLKFGGAKNSAPFPSSLIYTTNQNMFDNIYLSTLEKDKKTGLWTEKFL